jgi:hypothetical protein
MTDSTRTPFTPGPWKITEAGPARHLRIDGPGDEMIAALFRDQQHNAKLIVAAPALVALLREALAPYADIKTGNPPWVTVGRSMIEWIDTEGR